MGLIDQIRDAGVVGAGGAGFPTDRKLSCKAEIFIVNGIECEPLLRTDRHVMELHAPEIVRTFGPSGTTWAPSGRSSP